MTYDASNRKHIRQAEKRSKLDTNNRTSYLRQIMSTLSGRAWMHDHLAECAMFHEPFSPMSPHATSYNCGKQSVGRRLFDEVFTHCPTQYALMMQEAQAKEAVDERRNTDTADPTSSERSSSEDAGWDAQGSVSGYDTDARGLVYDESSGHDDPSPEVTH